MTAGPTATSPVSSPSATPQPEVSTMRYESARDELVAIVRRLESGAAELEESLALWERGEALAGRCQEILDGALSRLDTVRPQAEAAPTAPDVPTRDDGD